MALYYDLEKRVREWSEIMSGKENQGASTRESKSGSVAEVLKVSLKLGLTSFGGPIAHLGYFHNEYVRRRQWLDDRSYADLVALCQFLPGPASSQVGIGIGIMRAGMWGGLAAWIGFTLPSVIALVLFAFLLQGYNIGDAGWIHGLKLVAVAIVAHAVLGMGQKLAPDRSRATLALGAAVVTLFLPTSFTQVAIIAAAGVYGAIAYRSGAGASAEESNVKISVPVRRSVAVWCLGIFGALLVFLPLIKGLSSSAAAAMLDSFYRAGSLVFGGGHVVLPLLEREVVPSGWLSESAFLAGYGAAQAVPGPLFTFASYLGAVIGGWGGAAVATFAVFLPAFLLVVGTLPFWEEFRRKTRLQGALSGVNAAVVGILLAALYDPIWVSAVRSAADFALAAVLFGMLVFWKLPPWIVVAVGALAGAIGIGGITP